MTREVGDIAAALAYQVKKEIAQNFFGTRRALEEEKEELQREKEELLKEWEEKVLPFLRKIRLLLKGEEEGRAFLALIGEKALAGQREQDEGEALPKAEPSLPLPPFAWTRKSKYQKYLLALYRAAEAEARALEERFQALVTKGKLFNEDLTHFNTSFSLSEILSLTSALKEVDDAKCVLGENCEPEAVPHLEEKLRLTPLNLDESSLPYLPPLKTILKPLKELIRGAFRKYGEEIEAVWPSGFVGPGRK